jgi:hypothetical protein
MVDSYVSPSARSSANCSTGAAGSISENQPSSSTTWQQWAR